MAGSIFDSGLHARLFPTGEVGRLFSDGAEVRAMLLVEGALAEVQGGRGIIPEHSAAFIHRASMEVQVDPAALATATGRNGVSVPALVDAFRDAMQAPDHARYVHWGATSQDIMDTALMLRLRQALALIEGDLDRALARLATLAEAHARLPMPARTYGQHATPTAFGAVAAQWGAPLLALARALPALRAECLWVSLSGAGGTASALGPEAAALRADLAATLDLTDPGRGWHTDRTPLLRLADWLVRLTLALGKIGEDLTDLARTGIGEVTLGDAAGGSSTMPQKTNPVGPAALVALARQATGLYATLQGAAVHGGQRDGAAWFTEWLCLPQIVLGAASATRISGPLLDGLTPVPEAMATALDHNHGTIHAEALSFALAERMPRPEAQAAVKRLCAEAVETATPLAELARRDWPDMATEAVFDPVRGLGNAPDEAHRFAADVRARRQGPVDG